jgi:hypothetical protein
MPLTPGQRWHAAQAWLDDARAMGCTMYCDVRHKNRVVIEFPRGLHPSLKQQLECELPRFAEELRELLRK